MKIKRLYIVIFLILFTLIVDYFRTNHTNSKTKQPAVLNYELPVDLEVKNIFYRENAVHLNWTKYNTSGIGLFSKFKGCEKILCFGDFKPPFHLNKKPYNDTLYLTKDYKVYYLLISNEVK